ncbi:unnamed protein product, partial [Brenthis ino]
MDLISSIMIAIFIFMCLYLFWLWFCFGSCVERRQKTRSTQQRRTYMGSRQRPSEIQEPTIYVSPANLPPPPKYEAMAPPSYEEVVGIHYPNYQPHIQPITQPLSTALAQSSYPESGRSRNENTTGNSNTTENANTVGNNSGNSSVPPSTVVPIITDNRTTVTVAAS